ncbi:MULTISPECIES: transposase [Bacillus cereus group]|uniref:transposase n=1 Tax=Bacillus cereus group TaxID=86661 RepID=UPI0034D97C07
MQQKAQWYKYVYPPPTDIVPIGQVHDWYSLRWQIEILFKTWGAFFQIHHCKKIKPERLECYSTLLFYYVSNAPIAPLEEKTRT